MKHYIRLVLIGIFTVVISAYSQAQVIERSEQETLIYLSDLGDDKQTSPMDTIQTLDPIISQSKQRGWRKVYLEAITLKIEKLVNLERISEAQEQLGEVIPVAQEFDNAVILVRLAIAELNVLERQGYSEELNNKYRFLLTQAETIQNEDLIGQIYLAAGRMKSRVGDYTEALVSLRKAYNIAEKLNDLSFLDEVSGELGTANVRLENFEEGIAYYLKSLEISIEKNTRFDQSVILYNLGKAYLLNENFSKSKEMYEKSIIINKELKDDIGLMWSKRGLADLAIKQHHWSEAIELYNQTGPFFAALDDKMSEFWSYNGLTEAYIAIEDIAKAQTSLASSKRLLKFFPTSDNTIRYQQLLANLEALKGNYKTAFELTKDNIEIIKKDHFQKKKQEVERQRIQLDSELKETENRLLTEKNERQEYKIEQQNKQQKLWYLVIFIIAISLIIVTYTLYKQVQLRDSFKTMALRDHLTRCPNRRAILEYANSCFSEPVSEGKSLIIALIDLDNFKKFNDTYGHDVGDNVLIAFSKACKMSMRDDVKYGKYGRYGGEEWLIVLPNCTKPVAENIFARIKHNFSSAEIDGVPKEQNVTFSVGVQQLDKGKHKNVASMISAADNKLYTAKEHGKDKIVF
ncbi:diguanylate cyclase [Aliiglaciecola sp. 2_MG-2023]|uniref:tetratricopeptide repeat-containing diguanylate cyclase n=1 Tax=unclassified Aliiglaciecola TaxID=2593648 RepID=UPI0026E34C5C|nr:MULTISPECIES: tetratricopeptide repeat-containing diguanylate cyclase [unclassified Aliiglaciecola]MDO6713397.1 diguanylate cyclase [Aliiglaciecola sp. 2_MG-2023]MDO6754531.1 diguanylate cyclase [Aliiglaciecola sp. 1_MG-2023]